MKSSHGFLAAALAALLLSFVPLARAADSPESVRAQADMNIVSAGQLVHEAQQLLQGGYSPEKAKVALSLYVRAGQLFEQSGKMYRALAPNYAGEADIKNSDTALANCLRVIEEIKARLAH